MPISPKKREELRKDWTDANNTALWTTADEDTAVADWWLSRIKADREMVEEFVKIAKMDMPDHECGSALCPHYPRIQSFNAGVDKALSILKENQ